MRVSPPITPAPVMQERQRDFSAVIARDDANPKAAGSARRAAEDFVAMAFVEPMLAQMRESNNAAPPFAPGPGEKHFGEIMDRVMSRQIVRASRFPLVDRLESDLTARQAQQTEGILA
ncbi:hypothetical protein AY599_16305 [Leptolyngbya valderiana BDU 20041]|nr:hypothetical protein AY599_16305 [Leptolyngbya valderiana BDU 20041]